MSPPTATRRDAPRPPGLPRSSDDNLWIVLAHISLALGVGVIAPLVIYLVKKDQSPVVVEHAKEALNFQISIYIYSIACFPLVLVLIGIPLLIAVGAFGVILSIVAAIRASEGVLYRYPLTLRLIR